MSKLLLSLVSLVSSIFLAFFIPTFVFTFKAAIIEKLPVSEGFLDINKGEFYDHFRYIVHVNVYLWALLFGILVEFSSIVIIICSFFTNKYKSFFLYTPIVLDIVGLIVILCVVGNYIYKNWKGDIVHRRVVTIINSSGDKIGFLYHKVNDSCYIYKKDKDKDEFNFISSDDLVKCKLVSEDVSKKESIW